MGVRKYRAEENLALAEKELAKMQDLAPVKVNIRQIVLDQEALRFKDDGNVRRLLDSRKRRGRWLNHPIVQKSSMRCISGNHRVWAAKENGETEILVYLIDVTDEEAWAIRLEENLVRRKMPPKELYAMFLKARELWKWKQKQIAEAVGLSEGRVSQIMSWGDNGFQDPRGGRDSDGGQDAGTETQEPVCSNTAAANPAPQSLEIKESQDEPSSPQPVDDGDIPSPETEILSQSISPADPEPEMEHSEGLSASRPHGTGGGSLSLSAIVDKAFLEARNDPWPTGAWTKEQVLANHGRINGAIRSAAKYVDDPAMKEWLRSIYHFTKEALGYDK